MVTPPILQLEPLYVNESMLILHGNIPIFKMQYDKLKITIIVQTIYDGRMDTTSTHTGHYIYAYYYYR